MEPNYPGNIGEAPPAGSGSVPNSPQTEKRRLPTRKLLLIVAGIILVALLAVAGVLLNKGSRPNGSSDQSAESLRIERAGYEDVNEAVGDALALYSKPSDTRVQYGGTPVVQACTLITIKDVRDAGLGISANPLPDAVVRGYFDGKGAAPLGPPNDLFLPFMEDGNYCAYFLKEAKGLVETTVYQPAYASEKALSFSISRNFRAIADVAGLKAFEKETPPGLEVSADESTYLLQAKAVTAQIRLRTSDKTAKDKLLQLFAERLNHAASNPTPIETFEYNSPIFQVSTANPCNITDNNSFKTVLGVDAGPLVEERFGTAVGVIEDSVTQRKYNYVSHECKRRSGEASTKDKTLRISIDTYETAEGATALFAFNKSSPFTKNMQELATPVGDESFFADIASTEGALVFRKGRVLVSLSYFLPLESQQPSAEQRMQALTPLAKDLAENKLRDF